MSQIKQSKVVDVTRRVFVFDDVHSSRSSSSALPVRVFFFIGILYVLQLFS